MNGHLMVLETLIMSFQTLPIGIGTFNPDAFILLARYAGTIFASGMLLALPLVGSPANHQLGTGHTEPFRPSAHRFQYRLSYFPHRGSHIDDGINDRY